MPKNKPKKKNAFYFFAKERMEKLQDHGHRFPRGVGELLEKPSVIKEFQQLQDAEKIKYDNMATEYKQERLNPHKKFTTTGETYAEIRAKLDKEGEETRFMNECIEFLTSDSDPELLNTRDFVIVCTNHVCEVITGTQPEIWPAELSIVGFNLFYGIKNDYSTLIDTKNVPLGFASAAIEKHEETMLPEPGSDEFQPKHRNYKEILTKVRTYITRFVEAYREKYPIFVMPEDMKYVCGSVQWLIKNSQFDTQEEQDDFEQFFESVRYYKLTSLLLGLASAASRRDSAGYKSRIIAHGGMMEEGALHLLNISDYTFRDNINCSFHAQENESEKMKHCTRNRARRRIYLMLSELIPHMKIQKLDEHDIKYSPKAKPYEISEDLTTNEPTSTTHSAHPFTENPSQTGTGHSAHVIITHSMNDRQNGLHDSTTNDRSNASRKPTNGTRTPTACSSSAQTPVQSRPIIEFGCLPPSMFDKSAHSSNDSVEPNNSSDKPPEFGALPPRRGAGRGRPAESSNTNEEQTAPTTTEFGALPPARRGR